MPEKGKVKWFSNVKGYGFLEKEGADKDIFIHYSKIMGEGYKTLKSGEEVEFDIEEGSKGPTAVNINRITKQKKSEGKESPAES
ncbi:MAG: cold shock domain-containing protein [Candidatus Omnitrophica bacterium]|nr:cold shock domain-containing protein [Candidatus Omnitrophota bacterium]